MAGPNTDVKRFVERCDRAVLLIDRVARPIVFAMKFPDLYAPRRALKRGAAVKADEDFAAVLKALQTPQHLWPTPQLRHALKLVFETSTFLLKSYEVLLSEIYTPDARKVNYAINLYEEAIFEYQKASHAAAKRGLLLRLWRRLRKRGDISRRVRYRFDVRRARLSSRRRRCRATHATKAPSLHHRTPRM